MLRPTIYFQLFLAAAGHCSIHVCCVVVFFTAVSALLFLLASFDGRRRSSRAEYGVHECAAAPLPFALRYHNVHPQRARSHFSLGTPLRPLLSRPWVEEGDLAPEPERSPKNGEGPLNVLLTSSQAGRFDFRQRLRANYRPQTRPSWLATRVGPRRLSQGSRECN